MQEAKKVRVLLILFTIISALNLMLAIYNANGGNLFGEGTTLRNRKMSQEQMEEVAKRVTCEIMKSNNLECK